MRLIVISVILISTVSSLFLPRFFNSVTFLYGEKRKLLEALRLDNPPEHALTNHQRSIAMPAAVEESIHKWIDVREFEVTNEGGICELNDGSELKDCHRFKFDNYPEILKAELILDFQVEATREDVYMEVREFSDWVLQSWEISKIYLKSWRGGQIKIPITEHVKLWLSETDEVQLNVLMQIASRSVSTGHRVHTLRRTPILRIAYVRRSERTPRADSCHPDAPCCMSSFYVNFTEIGWSDWIIAPEGYWANYCVGECSAVHEEGEDKTLAILRHAHSNNSAFFVPPPSCAPTFYDSLKIVFAAGPNDVRTSVLHGMKVLGCGCLSHG